MAQLTVTVIVNARDAIKNLQKFKQELNAVQGITKKVGQSLQTVNRHLRDFQQVQERVSRSTVGLSRRVTTLQRSLFGMGVAARRAFQNIQQAAFRALSGQGAFFGVALRLFAPLGGVRRGVKEVTGAFVDLLRLFRGGVFLAPVNALNAMGRAIGGIAEIAGGAIAQIGLFPGTVTRLFSVAASLGRPSYRSSLR